MGQANNQAVTGRDMLAQNLTNAFSEQLCAFVSTNNTAHRQQMLANMANQIKNLKELIQPSKDVSSPYKSDDGDTNVSYSSKRNKKSRETSKPRKSLNREKWEG